MAVNRAVLMEFGERKKVIKIRSSMGVVDHAVLKEAFFNAFFVGDHTDVDVLFQLYDPDWSEYIDVDQDYKVSDKDRLKAVISTPAGIRTAENCQMTPSPLPNTSKGIDSFESQKTPAHQVNSDILQNYSELSDEDGDLTQSKSPNYGFDDDSYNSSDDMTLCEYEKRRERNIKELAVFRQQLGLGCGETKPQKTSMSATCPTPGRKSVLQPIQPAVIFKTGVKRERMPEGPLPNPFPLPQHFPAAVEVGLMNKDPNIIPKFATCIASSILCYKQYPTSAELTQVAQQIIDKEKYPWMNAKLGPPTGTLVAMLANRFKEFRRDRKTPKKEPKPAGTPGSEKRKADKPKKPAEFLMQPPPLPAGEDSYSFQRHMTILKAEAKKKKPNKEVASKLMDTTFAQRRAEILSSSAPIAELLHKYPFLGTEKELLNEMERISSKKDLATSVQREWKVWSKRILECTNTSKNTAIKRIHQECNPESTESQCVAALNVLCCLARDSRAKATAHSVTYIVPETCNMERVVEECEQPQPFLLVSGTLEVPLSAKLVIESTIITDVELSRAPAMLLAAFYAFNMHYPQGLQHFYAILEILFLDVYPPKVPIVVSNVLSLIQYRQD